MGEHANFNSYSYSLLLLLLLQASSIFWYGPSIIIPWYCNCAYCFYTACLCVLNMRGSDASLEQEIMHCWKEIMPGTGNLIK